MRLLLLLRLGLLLVLRLTTTCKADTPLAAKVGFDCRFIGIRNTLRIPRLVAGIRLPGHLRRERGTGGGRKRRTCHAAVTGQFGRGDAADIAVRVGTVGQGVIVGGGVAAVGSFEFRAALERTGEERLFLVLCDGGRLDVDNSVIIVGVHVGGGQEALIGGFIHVLSHICILVCWLMGRVRRE